MQQYANLPEQLLLEKLKGDDMHALTEIYNRYLEKLLAIAFYHSRDKQTAEDIVHDVMLSLWSRRKTLAIHALENYLATAVKFSVFKYFLQEKRRKEILSGNHPSEITDDIAAKLEEKLLAELLSGVIEQLPEKARLVFRYSRDEQLSIREISGKMDLSPKAVEYHMTKALRFLRDALKKFSAFI